MRPTIRPGAGNSPIASPLTISNETMYERGISWIVERFHANVAYWRTFPRWCLAGVSFRFIINGVAAPGAMRAMAKSATIERDGQ
jgi:hypothetical protein